VGCQCHVTGSAALLSMDSQYIVGFALIYLHCGQLVFIILPHLPTPLPAVMALSPTSMLLHSRWIQCPIALFFFGASDCFVQYLRDANVVGEWRFDCRRLLPFRADLLLMADQKLRSRLCSGNNFKTQVIVVNFSCLLSISIDWHLQLSRCEDRDFLIWLVGSCLSCCSLSLMSLWV
jgi:hypothetical protein